jgi:hypothetical protein
MVVASSWAASVPHAADAFSAVHLLTIGQGTVTMLRAWHASSPEVVIKTAAMCSQMMALAKPPNG